MAAYTATSWTISKLGFDIGIRGKHVAKRSKVGDFKLTLPSGGEVPAAGVPLPRSQMGFLRRPSYLLNGDIDANFTTATARAIKWNLNATAETVKAFRLGSASGAIANVGGRAIRPLSTAITLDTPHVLYIHVTGW